MKKLLSFLAVTVAMVATMSGNALAYFEDMNLIRVVYEKVGTREVATDLGNLNTLRTTGGGIVGGGADAFTNFIGTDFANLQVAYFAIDKANAVRDFYASGGDAAPTMLGNKWSTIQGAVGGVQGYYKGMNTSTGLGVKSNTNSYWNKLNKNLTSAAGTVAQSLTGGIIEMNLAALANGGFVSQSLYFWDVPGVTTASSVGVLVPNFTINTLADGSTVVTPIPGALVLFGSGLLGLVGIRRKAA